MYRKAPDNHSRKLKIITPPPPLVFSSILSFLIKNILAPLLIVWERPLGHADMQLLISEASRGLRGINYFTSTAGRHLHSSVKTWEIVTTLLSVLCHNNFYSTFHLSPPSSSNTTCDVSYMWYLPSAEQDLPNSAGGFDGSRRIAMIHSSTSLWASLTAFIAASPQMDILEKTKSSSELEPEGLGLSQGFWRTTQGCAR